MSLQSLHAFASKDDWQQEGAARFCVGEAFFRTSSQTGRDLGVLAAIALRKSTTLANNSHSLKNSSLKNSSLRILDAMTGCGVRPLRYILEAGADYVWANEGNQDLHARLSENLNHSLPPNRYCITHQDANVVFFDCHQRQDFYDLIDIDSFGSPMPVLANALWAVKLGGLLYLTSTDGRATSGHAPDASLQTYAAYARAHPAVHEQGLRLLIGLAAQQAAARGLSAKPVFAFYQGEVNRVMVQIVRQSAWDSTNYGFLSYCHNCGQFATVPWKKLGRTACVCGIAMTDATTQKPVISGPMWLGPLHNIEALDVMKQAAIDLQRQTLANHPDSAETLDSTETLDSAETLDSETSNLKTSDLKTSNLRTSDLKTSERENSERWAKCQALLEIMQAEAELPPYYYPLAEIGHRGKIDIPPRQMLIEQLTQAGFAATQTHISAQAIKTDAPMAICVQLAGRAWETSDDSAV